MMGEGIVHQMFEKLYSPLLMKTPVRCGVLLAFVGLFCTSIAVAPYIEVGLDQEISLPDDSYLIDYFHVSDAFVIEVFGTVFESH